MVDESVGELVEKIKAQSILIEKLSMELRKNVDRLLEKVVK